MTEQLTTKQLARVTLAMRNARTRIEADQKAKIDLDQACILFDLCTMLSVEPEAVLGEAMNLINDIIIVAEEVLQ